VGYDIQKARGDIVPAIAEKYKKGHFGVKTGRGFYDYGGRSEAEILEKRDTLYLKIIRYMEEIGALDPI
jgi:3-hydroxyacyl-CoA dehydrogenase